jgi:hypothetical protein
VHVTLKLEMWKCSLPFFFFPYMNVGVSHLKSFKGNTRYGMTRQSRRNVTDKVIKKTADHTFYSTRLDVTV